jgi:DNA-directed RNA polymerase subunit RPC12/RpoP
MAEKKVKDTVEKKEFHCPYCDEEMQQAKLPWCQSCGVKLTYCAACGKPVGREDSSCPHCGKKLAAK